MKKKSIIVISIIIIFLLAITISIKSIKQEKTKNTLKKIAEYYECEFVKEKNANEKGYSKKIFWIYDVPPVDADDGIQYKEQYETVLKAIAAQIKENFILIDNKHSIEIRVKYKPENNKISYLINNDNNFFQNEANKQIAKLQKEKPTTTINIISTELQHTIENEWSRKKTEKDYGNKIKYENSYDVYSSGIKVKTINSKIYNLIFLKEHQGNVFENITTGMDNASIRNILGQPTYENTEANLLIGYKTKDFYVFFSNGQISIYPVENFDENKNNQFAEIVSEYINNTNIYKETLQKVTQLYPDYSEYIQNEDSIDLKYPLKGFEIKMGKGERTGIYIYENYKGKISPNITKEDLESKTLNNSPHFNNNNEKEGLDRTAKIPFRINPGRLAVSYF